MPKKAKDPLEELEQNIKLLCDQANNHIKGREYDKALIGFNQALDLNGNDVNALVSRSRCYLLLGEPGKALQDANTALNLDKNSIRAIYQKAESLYYLGQFEQSLMFFHRGLRARPELTSFRLGIQKAQEAIENTIGSISKGNASNLKHKRYDNSSEVQLTDPTKQTPASFFRSKTSKLDRERRNAKKLLGELCLDKEYLENLLKHRDLKRADNNTENISVHAREAVEFLNKRQEFWRQQRPCTALTNHKNLPPNMLPAWF